MRDVHTIIRYFILSGAIVLSHSCKAPKPVAVEPARPMPASFWPNGKADALPVPLIHRRQFMPSRHLNDLIDTVIANNPDLRIASERVRYAGAVVSQTRGLLYPQVNAQAVPAIRRFGRYTMDGAGNIVTEMESGKLVPVNLPDMYIGAQASWEADIWGKLRNRKLAALSRFYATEEAKRLLTTALVAETAVAYHELLAYDQELRMLDENIRLQEEAIGMVRIQKESAVTNELAVKQFEVQLIDAKSLRIEVQQMITDTEARINFLAGRYHQRIPRDTAFFSEGLLPVIQAGISPQMLLERPDIRQAEYELKATDADLQAERAAFFPSLMLAGGFGFQAYRPGLLFAMPESIAYSLIAGLTAPVINRSQIRAAYEKATASRQEAVWNYRKLVTNAWLEAHTELRRLENLSMLYAMKKHESELISQSVSISNELFRYGRADYVEVLLTRQQALRVNVELINARRNQFLASIKLYRILGGGKE
jgi:NodT family efflux transporter outer membrane factor (OMF) lipoprotein